MSDDRCCCLIGGFLIMAEVCLAFSGLWFMMSYGAQDGGLPKGKKYYILYLACARFGGDTLNSCAVQWQHWPQTHNLRQKRACMSTPRIETYRKKETITWLDSIWKHIYSCLGQTIYMEHFPSAGTFFWLHTISTAPPCRKDNAKNVLGSMPNNVRSTFSLGDTTQAVYY